MSVSLVDQEKNTMQMVTVTEYLLLRLAELGIKDIIGVPGDFNLGVVEYIEHDRRFRFISECNELNAAYAADGYARIHGISALITTYGPGELSAVNGIAGAYAERVPVLKITGGIALGKQQKKLPLHHTLLTGTYDQSLKIFEQITCASGVITFDNPGAKIDQLIEACYKNKQPVYIQLPQDVAQARINLPLRKLDLLPSLITSETGVLVDVIIQKLNQSTRPVVIVGDLVDRYHLAESIAEFLRLTELPFVVSWAAKGTINEKLPNYAGMYAGEFSLAVVKDFVESSDCVLSLGMLDCEINHGEFTSKINSSALIDIQASKISLSGSTYGSDGFATVLGGICSYGNGLKSAIPRVVSHIPHYEVDYSNLAIDRIEHDHLIYHISKLLQNDDTLILETGTIAFTAGYYKLLNNAKIISSINWFSIGYALGATTGVALAKNTGRTILIVGDGSLQMTVQALSTMLRYGIKPIIFVINNAGYTIERVFLGANSSYNDIQPWHYRDLIATFGGEASLAQVRTSMELEQVIGTVNCNSDKIWLVEVMMDKYKAPEALIKLGQIVANSAKSL